MVYVSPMAKRPRILGGVLLALAGALCACDDTTSAPTNIGVCWRTFETPSGQVSFRPLLKGAQNLESCAATLEGAAIKAKLGTLTGAYQGQFIFITPDMVQSSIGLKGARYRLFDAETRRKVDMELRWRLEDAAHPSRFAPKDPRSALVEGHR